MTSSYTHTPLRDVTDVGPSVGIPDAVQAIRFAREPLEAVRTGITLHSFKPGIQSPVGHRHEQAEEIYVVIAGSGRAKLDDDVVELSALDALRVAPTVTRAFAAGPDGLELLAVGAHHPGDGELIHDWWKE